MSLLRNRSIKISSVGLINVVGCEILKNEWCLLILVKAPSKTLLVSWKITEDENPRQYQAVHTQSYINHETDAKPEQEGIFQASIIGIGSLSTVYRIDLIATLKQNILATSFLDVLNSGPIATLIKENTAARRNKLLENISEYLKIPTEPWLDVFDKVWKNTLSRLLIQIRSYNQGGAFLITKEIKGIKCKYEPDYSRLAEAVTRVSFFTAQVDLYEKGFKI